MKSSPLNLKTINRLQTAGLSVGLAALAIAIAGGMLSDPQRFYQSYLFSFMFWLGISLGSLAILMLHHLVGSRWGLTIRRVTEAGSSSIWLLAVLFIPIVFGLRTLYPWADPGLVAQSEILQHKSLYLNPPFFILRAVIFFAIWILLATLMNRWSARLSTREDPALRDRLRGWGAFGLILYVLTMSFASIDWMMSLEPFWNSTIYGLLVIIAQVMTGLALGVLVLNLLPGISLGKIWPYQATPIPYKDLGALMLVFVMGWAYLAYFQLLIIWAGNLPREVTWYLNRTEGGWLPVAVILVVLQFALPFLMLLSIRARHNLRVLAGLGAVLLLTHLINMYWQVIPSFSPGQFSLHWLDLALPVAMGGLWLWVFFYFLKKRPGLPEVEQAILEASEQAEILVS